MWILIFRNRNNNYFGALMDPALYYCNLQLVVGISVDKVQRFYHLVKSYNSVEFDASSVFKPIVDLLLNTNMQNLQRCVFLSVVFGEVL